MRTSDDPTGASAHIGYLLSERGWGKGYATELVQGVLRSLEGAGIALLIAGVGKTNIASARVLLKSGFCLDRALSSEDTDVFTYNIQGAPVSKPVLDQ